MLWRCCGKLPMLMAKSHDYEANLVRRVAGLLYVQDRESGRARKRVLERLNLDESE